MILLEEGLNVRLLQSLRKKYSRQKELRVNKQQRCSLCLKSSIANPLQHLPLNNLKKKYYFPQIETYHYRAANNLIYGITNFIQILTVDNQSKLSKVKSSSVVKRCCKKVLALQKQCKQFNLRYCVEYKKIFTDGQTFRIILQ